MALELLTLWGATAAWTCVFKPILEDLAKDVAKGWAKDFASGSLKHVLAGHDEWTKAAGKAAKEFVEQFEQELVGAGETETTCEHYDAPLRRFMADSQVREALGAAVLSPEASVDFALLQRRWDEVAAYRLPNDFSWTRLCRRFQNKVRGILQASAELRAILDSANTDATRVGIQRLAGIDPGFDLTRYRESLITRYGNLKLELMDAGATVPIQLARVFVEQNVRDCQQFNPRHHELPKEHQRLLEKKKEERKELAEKQLKEIQQAYFLQHQRVLEKKQEKDEEPAEEQLKEIQQAYFLQQTRPVMELISDPSRRLLIFLGDPGSGKSVLLQYLALQWANRPVVELTAHPIPLLIELRTYVQKENLGSGQVRNFLEYLERGVGCCAGLDRHHLHAALQRGSAFFLVDGIDEIFDPQTLQAVVNDVAELTHRYPQARFVVTSRVVGYQHETLRDAGFSHFMLQDLEPEQIAAFSDRWHRLAYADATERVWRQTALADAIRRSRSVAELAGNPLLLTLMALLNRQQELPRDRTELYDQASRLLLQNWDASRALQDDPLLADKSFDHRNKQSMLRAIAYRMQTGPKGLAGNAISVDDLKDTLADWLTKQGYQEPRPLADRLIRQLRGRNFILCFLGDDFYAFIHRTFLEYFCAWDLVWRYEKDRAWKLEQLQAETFDAHWQNEKWHEVLRLVAARLEPKFAGQLITSLIAKEDPLFRLRNLFLAAESLSDIHNRSEIAPLDSQLRSLIQQATVFDLPYYYDSSEIPVEVRRRAAVTLALVWVDDLSKEYLSQCAQSSRYSDVRQAAIQELARGWKDNPDTLLILKECARSDEIHEVRRAAIQEVARGWKHDPDTLLYLKERSRTDKHYVVQCAAIQELARGWKDEPDTLLILKERARSDEIYDVRRAAIRELARGWKDDPDILVILKECARSDEHWAVLQTAIQELVRGWKDDPDALSILKARACTDTDNDVRQGAIQELERGWKDDSSVISFLRKLEK